MAIWKFVRNSILIVVGLILLAALCVGAYQGYEAISKSMLQAKVDYDPIQCVDPAYPLKVQILNNSYRTTEKVWFNIGAYRPGHSTNLAKDGRYLSIDRIMKPGEGWASCWRIPGVEGTVSDQSMFEWRIEIASVSFQ